MTNSPEEVGYRPGHRRRPQPRPPARPKWAGVAVCGSCVTVPPKCVVCLEYIKRGEPFWHIERVVEGDIVHAHKSCAKEHL